MDAIVVALGDRIQVSAELFDALRHAGLLQVLGQTVSGDATWDYHGEEQDDDSVVCVLVSQVP